MKTCVVFSSNFHQKSMANRCQKLEKRYSREKTIKCRFLAPLFGPRINFWSILGFRPGPKTETFGLPVHFILFTLFAISPKRARTAPRRPRGRPSGLPGTLQGTPRGPPGTILLVFFVEELEALFTALCLSRFVFFPVFGCIPKWAPEHACNAASSS